MLFQKPFKEAIAAGQITASFRAWKKPMAKVGGEYNIPPYGAIRVTGLSSTTIADASLRSIRDAGFEDKANLTTYLKVTDTAQVYLVRFHHLGAKQVNQPDRDVLSSDALTKLADRLTKIDWAMQVLSLIEENPRIRAGDLAPICGMELAIFKRNVRRLKGMGLTLSHDVGYELSERGRQVLSRLRGIG
jgi:hypothetical protein